MIGQKGIPAKYGGVERHVHELSTRLASFGHGVTVYGRRWYSSEEGVFEGVNRVNTPGVNTKHLDAITHTLTATIHAVMNKNDVIHYHAVGPALLSWIPRIFAPRTRIVTTFHCIDRYHQKWGWFARFALRLGEFAACRFAHKTITVSQTLKQYCLNEFQADAIYIPNGVAGHPHTCGNSAERLAKFDLEADRYVVMVSRLVKHKGAHLLIEAFRRFKQKQEAGNPHVERFKLAIVGGSSHTDAYVQELREMASSDPDIVFTGYQSGIALEELFAHSIALVHPSMNEGMPFTVLEAMSHGKPVLLSDIPEHLELIGDLRAIFAQNSVESIERTLESFFALSEEEKNSMGTENKRKVQKEFDWDNIVGSVDTLYKAEVNDANPALKRAQA